MRAEQGCENWNRNLFFLKDRKIQISPVTYRRRYLKSLQNIYWLHPTSAIKCDRFEFFQHSSPIKNRPIAIIFASKVNSEQSYNARKNAMKYDYPYFVNLKVYYSENQIKWYISVYWDETFVIGISINFRWYDQQIHCVKANVGTRKTFTLFQQIQSGSVKSFLKLKKNVTMFFRVNTAQDFQHICIIDLICCN